VYLIQQRGMNRRYAPVIREDLGKFKRSPGRDRAPEPVLSGPIVSGESLTPAELRSAARRAAAPADARYGKSATRQPTASSKQSALSRQPAPSKQDLAKALPAGIYVAVSNIGDLFVLQSDRPVRVIFTLNDETAAYLLGAGKPPPPFTRRELILALDPWFPQAAAARLKEQIGALRELGYSAYIVNNPGHFALFRDSHPEEKPPEQARAEPRSHGKPRSPAETLLIAGPWLYTFNRWSAAFVAALGANALITPLENNRQNLERTIDPPRRAFTFVTLFARPALFRIRADLSGYGFGAFSDGRGEDFRLESDAGGSRVIPERPFSIVDKRPFLEQAGFRRFIIDLSGLAGTALKKKDYRSMMDAVKAACPLSGISRFNWKDGFFSPEQGTGKPEERARASDNLMRQNYK
jgi:putative protease